MTRAISKMPSIVNVVAGATAFINLPVGPIYDALMLRYVWDNSSTLTLANQAKFGSDFTEIRLKLDGRTVRTYRGTELGDLNAYYGRTHKDGIMPIYLANPWWRIPASEDATGWATGFDVRAFTVEIDIASGAVPSSLELYAVQRAAPGGKPIPMGLHVAVKRYTGNAGSTGRLDWTDLPLEPNARLLAAHFKTANIDDIEVKANGRVIFDADDDIVEDWLERRGVERVKQSGYFPVDFTETGRMGDGLPLAGLQDLRFRPQFTSSGAFTVIAETLEVWQPS